MAYSSGYAIQAGLRVQSTSCGAGKQSEVTTYEAVNSPTEVLGPVTSKLRSASGPVAIFAERNCLSNIRPNP